ncbi:MAG: trans-sulfuration enzyme family protein [Frankia sp.]
METPPDAHSAWRPETRAVTAGRPRGPGDPLNTPPVHASTFRDGGEFTYGRFGNPTWSAFEEALGELEHGRALAFGSGMAAVSAVLATLSVGGHVLVPSDAYTGVRAALTDAAARGRLRFTPLDMTDTAAVLGALKATGADQADLLWVESPTNPLLGLVDLPVVLAAAAERRVPSVVDNTFATPMLQQPLTQGATAVLHSATKFLGGHSDLVLGAIVTRDGGLAERLHQRRTLDGGLPGVSETWLALRGLRTLPVRLAHAQASAGVLAERLAGHPLVARVRYPGLGTDPGHRRAAAQMTGFGAVLSFDLPDASAADRLLGQLRLVVATTSLGGVESTADRRGRWAGEEYLPAGLIRLSVGLEHVDDLWDDLRDALATIDPGS